MMLKKGLAVAVILLFIGVAVAPSIAAIEDPVADLDCYGELAWVDIVPGATVDGVISVENIGEPGSLLDWEIQSWPDWGEWTFYPDNGTGLTPEFGEYDIHIEAVAPNEPMTEFDGEIKIVNMDNPDDFCIIELALVISTNADVEVVEQVNATPIEFEFQRIRDLVQSIDLRKIIVNPDAVIDTIEEISAIIEENEDIQITIPMVNANHSIPNKLPLVERPIFIFGFGTLESLYINGIRINLRGIVYADINITNAGGEQREFYFLIIYDKENNQIYFKKQLPIYISLVDFAGYLNSKPYYIPHGPQGTGFTILGFSTQLIK